MSNAALHVLSTSPPSDSASDAHLLSSLCPGVSTATWTSLLELHGGLRGLITTPDSALSLELPLGALTALRSAFQLSARFATAVDPRPLLKTPGAIYD
jgi:hypothetical protein